MSSSLKRYKRVDLIIFVTGLVIFEILNSCVSRIWKSVREAHKVGMCWSRMPGYRCQYNTKSLRGFVMKIKAES